MIIFEKQRIHASPDLQAGIQLSVSGCEGLFDSMKTIAMPCVGKFRCCWLRQLRGASCRQLLRSWGTKKENKETTGCSKE